MLTGKTFKDFTNPFAPNIFKKNDNIILKYFMAHVYKKVF